MRNRLRTFIFAFGLMLAAFAGREAFACPDLATCEALSATNTAPACCCLLWDRFASPPASQNACLNSNGYTTYNGAGAPPASCAEFKTDAEASIGFCPAGNPTQCTNQVIGNRTCICKAGFVWEGDGCVAVPPPAPPVCPAATAANIDQHVCSSLGCAPSELPFPGPANGATFDGLANPMAACCGRGWGENTGSASKFDCVEAVSTPGTTFRNFYLAGSSPDNTTTAGLTYPNQVFMLDKNGVPLSGFYTQSGVRCGYRKPSNHSTVVQLTRDQQMQVFAAAMSANPMAIPTPFPNSIDAEVDPMCCTLIVFALERQCPSTDTFGVKTLATTISGTTRRCTAAKRMQLDYGVYDLCDLSLVHRNRFRPSTNYQGEDPKYATVELGTPINIKNLTQVFYPPPAPGMAPSCPISPAIWRENFTGGMCRILGEAP
ncbi:MAG: hypothetical protein JST04_03770 [Bdellovibrionales bacterium]|nr:hypothetical protein [Bdellovibrionales bacterium]